MADLDERGRARLSYQQAEALFAKAPGGATRTRMTGDNTAVLGSEPGS